MFTQPRNVDWLPDHQLHVASTLAHANELAARCWDVLEPYQRDGIITMNDHRDGDRIRSVIAAVAPLPRAVALYVADMLTQLRAALEHTIYAEVKRQLGRDLTESEARAIEMPACVTSTAFEDWLKHRSRRDLKPLQEGPLPKRIEDVQPFQRRDVDRHPLQVLVKHTNTAKHRMPAIAAVHVGRVQPDLDLPDVRTFDGIGSPARVGDVLIDAPVGTVVPVNIWPSVAIRRPHTGEWKVLLEELRELYWWVRQIAIPTLVVGRTDVPTIPAQFDTCIGHDDERTSLTGAGDVTSFERASTMIMAAIARDGLRDTLALHPSQPDRRTLTQWIESLTDTEAVERVQRMQVGHSQKVARANLATVEALLAECARWQPASTEGGD